MFAAGMLLVWAGYGVSSYGWILLRGLDVPFRSWMSPLNPYQWPAGGPALIPDNQLFPGSAPAGGKVTPADPNFWRNIGKAANPFGAGAGSGAG